VRRNQQKKSHPDTMSLYYCYQDGPGPFGGKLTGKKRDCRGSDIHTIGGPRVQVPAGKLGIIERRSILEESVIHRRRERCF
jgi:hypothetical protein